MIRKLFALSLCFVSFTAFSQESKPKDLYLGLDKKEVIEKLGMPTAINKVAGNSETLVYIFKSINKAADAAGQKAQQAKEKMHMYTFSIDKNGKVSSWEESYPESK